LTVVVLTHLAEALHLFPGMGGGSENSIGHYVDLGGAVLGLLLFPTGYLLYALGGFEGILRPVKGRSLAPRSL